LKCLPAQGNDVYKAAAAAFRSNRSLVKLDLLLPQRLLAFLLRFNAFTSSGFFSFALTFILQQTFPKPVAVMSRMWMLMCQWAGFCYSVIGKIRFVGA
jgi:hypothetical protein